MRPTTHHLTINGSKARYWVFNPDQPQTLVMVHGFRGNHLGLLSIIEHLTDYRVIVPDLPGFGCSTPMPHQRHDVAAYSDFMLAFIDALKLGKCVLVGHSFGSLIAAKLAVEAPERFRSLILISPLAERQLHHPGLFTKLTRLYYWLGCTLPGRAGQVVLDNRLYIWIECALLVKTHDKPLKKKIYKHHLNDLQFASRPRVIRESFRAMMLGAVKDAAPNIKLKTLIITGEKDNVVKLAAQQSLARQINHATLVVIPTAGHLANLEAPSEVAAAIDHFVQEQP